MINDQLAFTICAYALAALAVAVFVSTLLAKYGFPVPAEGRRIGCVDGLRGALALGVVVHHFVIWTLIARFGHNWEPPEINFFNNLGAGAVALFFMVTGLVFYPRVRAGFRQTSWIATYINRLFRIVPLIVVSVLIVTWIAHERTGNLPGADYPIDALKWISAWGEPDLLNYRATYRINAYVLWSLKYEWLFYLVLMPMCALAMDWRTRFVPSWCVPVGLFAACLILLPATGMSVFKYLPLFAIGMVAYEIQLREDWRRPLMSRWFSLVAILCLAVAMIWEASPYGFFQYILYGVFFVAVAAGNDLFGFLRLRGMLVLGECSYGIYILHGTVLSLVFTEGAWMVQTLAIGSLPALLVPIFLIVTVVTSTAFLLVERPLIEMGAMIGRRFLAWTSTRSQLTAAP